MLATMTAEKERAGRAIGLIHGAISETLELQRGRKSELSPVGLSILYATTVRTVRMNDVAAACGVRKSTASRYIDGLENKGLVRRSRDGTDKRVVYVLPTAKGRSLIAANERKLATYVEKGMARLSPPEQQTFVDLLVKFTGTRE